MSSLTITLRQAVQIGHTARSDAVLPTLRHIPGSVVRGALAAAWIREHGKPTLASRRRQEFLDLFEGGVRYGPLFAGEPPWPLSVLAHKYDQDDPRCDFRYFDEVELGSAPAQCPDCRGPLEQLRTQPDDSVPVRRRTSVAVQPSGVAQRGVLFSRDAISPATDEGAPVTFTGHLVASDAQLLETLAKLNPIWLGGRRTTHGLATVSIDPAVEVALPQRLGDHSVVLRLRSPGVFVDPQGRPAPTPEPGELTRVLGSPVTIVRQWVRWHTVGGWHIASGLPKHTELTAGPGSTYVITTKAELTDGAVARLARRGVGLRRHEGFGDLGGPPSLPPGKIGREREHKRISDLANLVRPLLRLSTDLARWSLLEGMLARHANGDRDATERLHAYAEGFGGEPGQALRSLLSYPLADTVAVLRELKVTA